MVGSSHSEMYSNSSLISGVAGAGGRGFFEMSSYSSLIPEVAGAVVVVSLRCPCTHP